MVRWWSRDALPRVDPSAPDLRRPPGRTGAPARDAPPVGWAPADDTNRTPNPASVDPASRAAGGRSPTGPSPSCCCEDPPVVPHRVDDDRGTPAPTPGIRRPPSRPARDRTPRARRRGNDAGSRRASRRSRPGTRGRSTSVGIDARQRPADVRGRARPPPASEARRTGRGSRTQPPKSARAPCTTRRHGSASGTIGCATPPRQPGGGTARGRPSSLNTGEAAWPAPRRSSSTPLAGREAPRPRLTPPLCRPVACNGLEAVGGRSLSTSEAREDHGRAVPDVHGRHRRCVVHPRRRADAPSRQNLTSAVAGGSTVNATITVFALSELANSTLGPPGRG